MKSVVEVTINFIQHDRSECSGEVAGENDIAWVEWPLWQRGSGAGGGRSMIWASEEEWGCALDGTGWFTRSGADGLVGPWEKLSGCGESDSVLVGSERVKE